MSPRRDHSVDREWHGQKIFTEADLGEVFDDEPTAEQQRRARRKRRRHGWVLALLLILLVAVGGVAWQVIRGEWEIPGWERSPAPSVLPCPTQSATYAQTSRVNVYNGTSLSGLAGDVATALTERGFTVGETGNRYLSNQRVVAVVVSGPEGQDTALAVQRNLEGAQFQPDERADDSVDVVMGADFEHLTPAERVDEAPGVLFCPEHTAAPGSGEPAAPSSSSTP